MKKEIFVISKKSNDYDPFKNRMDCSIEKSEGKSEFYGDYILRIDYMSTPLLKEDLLNLHRWIEDNLKKESEK